LWPRNVRILEAFVLVAGQWRRDGRGRIVALDYAAVEAGLRMAGIAVDRELFEGLRICEREVLAHG